MEARASRRGLERKAMLALSMIGILLAGSSSTTVAAELRGVWVTRWSYSTRADIEAIVAELDAANFNAVFFQVRGRADAFYRSSLEPWSADLSGTLGVDPGWDPLAEMIAVAHARGMQVHAWVNTFPAWSGDVPPEESMPRHAMLAHPEWLCPPVREGYRFFSPGNLEVRAHLVKVIGELEDNYDVDGIHLDFVRYPGAACDNGDADTERDQITALIEALRPRVRFLSVASWGVYENRWGWRKVSQGKIDFMQDAHRWARESMIDALVPMIYWPATTPKGGRLDFQTLTDDHLAATQAGHAQLFTGISAALPLSQIEKEIRYARTAGASGFVIFDYASMRDRLAALKDDVLAERARPPKR